MTVIDISKALSHLRLESDTPDHTLVKDKLEEAEYLAMRYINRRFYPDETALKQARDSGEANHHDVVINPNIRAGVLFILAHLYEHRGDEGGVDIPLSALTTLNLERNMKNWG